MEVGWRLVEIRILTLFVGDSADASRDTRLSPRGILAALVVGSLCSRRV